LKGLTINAKAIAFMLIGAGTATLVLTGYQMALTYCFDAQGEIVAATEVAVNGRPTVKYDIKEPDGDVVHYNSASSIAFFGRGLQPGTSVEKQRFSFAYRIDGREYSYPVRNNAASMIGSAVVLILGLIAWRGVR
jgi:hypothetical protein